MQKYQAILSKDHLNTELLNTNFRASAADAGAIATFAGIMRPTSKSGAPLDRMILQAHPTLTQRSLDDIVHVAANKFDIKSALAAHRHGAILPNETIVFVAVAADHRREAFNAVDYLMDRLKSDAAFWKREEGPHGKEWIDPTSRDTEDLKRWS